MTAVPVRDNIKMHAKTFTPTGTSIAAAYENRMHLPHSLFRTLVAELWMHSK